MFTSILLIYSSQTNSDPIDFLNAIQGFTSTYSLLSIQDSTVKPLGIVYDVPPAFVSFFERAQFSAHFRYLKADEMVILLFGIVFLIDSMLLQVV